MVIREVVKWGVRVKERTTSSSTTKEWANRKSDADVESTDDRWQRWKGVSMYGGAQNRGQRREAKGEGASGREGQRRMKSRVRVSVGGHGYCREG